MNFQDTSLDEFLSLVAEYKHLGIDRQVNYDKYSLYSLVTHSTAIEGSTVTEVENQIMFEQGLAIQGKTLVEQHMNLDLKVAYEVSQKWAQDHNPVSVEFLKLLAAQVMKNTGQVYNTALGTFSSSQGDFRLLNVTAGVGGRSYMNYSKVPDKVKNLCAWINEARENTSQMSMVEKYNVSFDAHYELVTIHPWADGNGRMGRLLMNHLQFEFGLIPSRITKDDKEEYIKALVQTRESEDYDLFRRFMVRNMIKNLKADIAGYLQSVKIDATHKFHVSDAQIFSSQDNYKISCRINGERQLGVVLSSSDKQDWDNIRLSNDASRQEAFKQHLAEKYFGAACKEAQALDTPGHIK